MYVFLDSPLFRKKNMCTFKLKSWFFYDFKSLFFTWLSLDLYAVFLFLNNNNKRSPEDLKLLKYTLIWRKCVLSMNLSFALFVLGIVSQTCFSIFIDHLHLLRQPRKSRFNWTFQRLLILFEGVLLLFFQIPD